jgi:hypothetical protein
MTVIGDAFLDFSMPVMWCYLSTRRHQLSVQANTIKLSIHK